MNPQRYKRLLEEVKKAQQARKKAEQALAKKLKQMSGSKKGFDKPEDIQFLGKTTKSYIQGVDLDFKDPDDVNNEAKTDKLHVRLSDPIIEEVSEDQNAEESSNYNVESREGHLSIPSSRARSENSI